MTDDLIRIAQALERIANILVDCPDDIERLAEGVELLGSLLDDIERPTGKRAFYVRRIER